MDKFEEEEIPLLDLETPLDSEDAQNYFEAFKQFDHNNTGHISNRVLSKCYNLVIFSQPFFRSCILCSEDGSSSVSKL